MTEQCSGCCQGDAKTSTPQSIGDQTIDRKGYVSQFRVPKMDCPSEEGMIRLALEALEPKVFLEFDTPNRTVRVFHGENADLIEEKMKSVGLGAMLEHTQPASSDVISQVTNSAQQKEQEEAGVLKWLLFINAIMFVVEITVGWWAQSTGLIADSLDMFADAAVYGVALYAVGHSIKMKVRAAHLSGWLQVILALGALSEVLRRFIFGSDPVSSLMMGFGLIALVANVTCLLLISKNRDGGAHMKASWIFSANDVIANLGVIIAGGLVAWTGSRYPDLVIGLIIGMIVLNGARRILKIKS
ncbi:MAG: cation transporter [Pseudomonadales bacterium]|nr:cation transporter [Pseudomonadales bacterium]